MIENDFISSEINDLMEAIGIKKHLGSTNGETIYINFFSGTMSEDHIEEVIDMVYTHELIHIYLHELPDFNYEDIPERKVEYMSKLIFLQLKE